MDGRPGQDRVLFEDRRDAGRKLGELLARLALRSPMILALPRGGVLVGMEVARRLNAPLDVVVARKLGAPGQPELAIGALAPDGVRVLDPRAVAYMESAGPATQASWEGYLQRTIQAESAELTRRQFTYRNDLPPLRITGCTVVLVDDGLATGMTARAALQWLRQQRPERLVLAVPVAAVDTAAELREAVDDFVCLATPPDFMAVGLHYADFRQATDQEVLEALRETHAARGPQSKAA